MFNIWLVIRVNSYDEWTILRMQLKGGTLDFGILLPRGKYAKTICFYFILEIFHRIFKNRMNSFSLLYYIFYIHMNSFSYMIDNLATNYKVYDLYHSVMATRFFKAYRPTRAKKHPIFLCQDDVVYKFIKRILDINIII